MNAGALGMGRARGRGCACRRGCGAAAAAHAAASPLHALAHTQGEKLEELPTWIHWEAQIPATGSAASAEERAAALAGEVLPGKVVMWGNSAFESKSNDNITAQQEEVRAEVRRS